MRFPIYFFLLMSGFFYLTGNPFYNKETETAQTGVDTQVAQLKYGRQVSGSSTAGEPAILQVKTAKPKAAVEAKSPVKVAVAEKKSQTSTVANVQEPSLVPSALKTVSTESETFGNKQTKSFQRILPERRLTGLFLAICGKIRLQLRWFALAHKMRLMPKELTVKQAMHLLSPPASSHPKRAKREAQKRNVREQKHEER